MQRGFTPLQVLHNLTVHQMDMNIARVTSRSKTKKPKLVTGFTLVELLIVIALIAILASTIIIGLNPARQFSQARNAERWAHLNGLATATHQNRVENNGIWNCASGALPGTATVMRSSAGGYDVCPCLVPTITRQLGFDPSAGGAHYTDCADYDTGYTIMQATGGRITIAAPSAELGAAIGVTQ